MRTRAPDTNFPDRPGVYVLYGEGPHPLYVGVAATQSLAERWGRQHLRDRAGGSALRRSLGVHLGLVKEKLTRATGRYYEPDVEQGITSFLESCEIELYEAPDASAARLLEAELIDRLAPTLNVVGRRSIEKRAKSALAAGLRAVKPDVPVDGRGYVCNVEDNLLPGIARAEIEAEFAAGSGNEFESKMLAPWSSSALAVNSFARWRSCPDRLELGGIGAHHARIAFEMKCRHGVRGERPHLDVVLEGGNSVVGIESKCIEYTRSHRRAVVAPAYWNLRERGDSRACSRWFEALAHVHEFERFDAYQLVKHYLGLACSYRGTQRTLVYLYWEASNAREPLFIQHRDEIERFASLVAGDRSCRFVATSYARHWQELEAVDDPPTWLADHQRLLRLRYEVTI